MIEYKLEDKFHRKQKEIVAERNAKEALNGKDVPILPALRWGGEQIRVDEGCLFPKLLHLSC